MINMIAFQNIIPYKNGIVGMVVVQLIVPTILTSMVEIGRQKTAIPTYTFLIMLDLATFIL